MGVVFLPIISLPAHTVDNKTQLRKFSLSQVTSCVKLTTSQSFGKSRCLLNRLLCNQGSAQDGTSRGSVVVKN